MAQVRTGDVSGSSAKPRACGLAVQRGTRRGGKRQRAVSRVTADMPDTETVLRELNYRVKNNFQIIVSLMNLRKRMLPPERREDIRFIEEHVQSMSVAYRLVYATGSIVDVPLSELVHEVVSGLRQIAGLSDDQMRVESPVGAISLGLDNSIALALYLAVLMPPYLDQARVTTGMVSVTVSIVSDVVTIAIRGSWNQPIALDFLRGRLMRAYANQLGAEIVPDTPQGEGHLRFSLAPL